jgi:DNA (cytosine-5)-methyltransferase 1
MLTFGELFAGIGGFSLGLERAGMKCAWQVEIDPYARAVLNKHWPDVPKHDDVRTFPPTHTHTHTQDFSVDLICGGFPCQDISYAGKGAGLAGARSGLWHEFARIIGEIRPKYVLVENVAALLTRGMGDVLGTLASLGYDAEWHVIPASAVGAPHRRERVWIIGVRVRNDTEANSPCSDSDCFGSHHSDMHVIGDAELQYEQDRVAGSVCCDVSDANYKSQSALPVHDVSRCGVPEFAGSDVADTNRWRQQKRSELHRSKIQQQTYASQRNDVGGCRSHVPNADSAGRQQQRRPEPTSAEQLAAERSGWWESEPDVGRVAHGVPSRVDRLRCLGNAVVPQVVEVIGRAIVEHEKNRTASGMRP